MPCPICNDPDIKKWESGKLIGAHFKCPRCGEYTLAFQAEVNFLNSCAIFSNGHMTYEEASQDSRDGNPLMLLIYNVGGENVARSIVSHVLRKSGAIPTLNKDSFINILKNTSLPTIAEQANNLIMFLATRQKNYGFAFDVTAPSSLNEIAAQIGITIGDEANNLEFLRAQLLGQNILNSPKENDHPPYNKLSLSFTGWQKYDELKRSVKNSKKAFMAMAFARLSKEDDKNNEFYFQNTLLNDYLKPAALLTEFKLANPLLDPMAGNIHARMEVEIRESRFLVAEISSGNQGAYWEAGFAKGLGKPVIYMCKKGITPHFDVSSDFTIFWEQDNPKKAASALKDMIRSTLPDEAIMSDPDETG